MELTVLGAVGAGIQVASSCYEVALALCKLPSEKRRMDVIRNDILYLRTEITGRLTQLSAETRKAAETLLDQLEQISKNIDACCSKRFPRLLKPDPRKELCQSFVFAMKKFQVCAVAVESAALVEITNRLGPDGIPKQIKEALEQRSQQLEDLLVLIEDMERIHVRLEQTNDKLNGIS